MMPAQLPMAFNRWPQLVLILLLLATPPMTSALGATHLPQHAHVIGQGAVAPSSNRSLSDGAHSTANKNQTKLNTARHPSLGNIDHASTGSLGIRRPLNAEVEAEKRAGSQRVFKDTIATVTSSMSRSPVGHASRISSTPVVQPISPRSTGTNTAKRSAQPVAAAPTSPTNGSKHSNAASKSFASVHPTVAHRVHTSAVANGTVAGRSTRIARTGQLVAKAAAHPLHTTSIDAGTTSSPPAISRFSTVAKSVTNMPTPTTAPTPSALPDPLVISLPDIDIDMSTFPEVTTPRTFRTISMVASKTGAPTKALTTTPRAQSSTPKATQPNAVKPTIASSKPTVRSHSANSGGSVISRGNSIMTARPVPRASPAPIARLPSVPKGVPVPSPAKVTIKLVSSVNNRPVTTAQATRSSSVPSKQATTSPPRVSATSSSAIATSQPTSIVSETAIASRAPSPTVISTVSASITTSRISIATSETTSLATTTATSTAIPSASPTPTIGVRVNATLFTVNATVATNTTAPIPNATSANSTVPVLADPKLNVTRTKGPIVAIRKKTEWLDMTRQCHGRILKRKEVRQLTTREWQDFVGAVRAMHSGPSPTQFDKLARVHQLFAPDAHGLPDFLPWHRLYVAAFQEQLWKHNPRVVMPYWKWSLDSQLPHASQVLSHRFFGGNGNSEQASCVTTGAFANWKSIYVDGEDSKNVTCISRTYDDGDRLGPFYSTESINAIIITSDTFDDFRTTLEGPPHGSIHTNLGGSFSGMSASADPLFWAHHAYVDMIWWQWQKRTREHMYDFGGTVDSSNQTRALDDMLPPFDVNNYASMDTEGPGLCYTYVDYNPVSSLRATVHQAMEEAVEVDPELDDAMVMDDNDPRLERVLKASWHSNSSDDRPDTSRNLLPSERWLSREQVSSADALQRSAKTEQGRAVPSTRSLLTTDKHSEPDRLTGRPIRVLEAFEPEEDDVAVADDVTAPVDTDADSVEDEEVAVVVEDKVDAPAREHVRLFSGYQPDLTRLKLPTPLPSWWIRMNHMDLGRVRRAEARLRNAIRAVNQLENYLSPSALLARQDDILRVAAESPDKHAGWVRHVHQRLQPTLQRLTKHVLRQLRLLRQRVLRNRLSTTTDP